MASSSTASKPQIITHISHSLMFTPYCAQWIPMSARLVVFGMHPRGTGALQVMEMKKGKLHVTQECEQAQGIKCATFGASAYEKRHVATGDMKGGLCIWDLEAPREPIFHNRTAHTQTINAIDGCGGLNIGHGACELVTGSRDGCVKVWDVRQADPVMCLEPADGEPVRDCWSVAFGNSYNNDERSVVCGYDNGDIKLLDLRTQSLVWETNVQNGVVNVEFDRKDVNQNKLLITGLESQIHVYDMRTQHPDAGFARTSIRAHNSTVWQGKHLPQNRDVFATAGGNGSVNLYKYVYPSERVTKDSDGVEMGVPGTLTELQSTKVCDQPILSFNWSADKQGLCVMACLDQSVKIGLVTKLQTI